MYDGLLNRGPYRRYWIALVISLIGDGITRTAVLFLIGAMTNNPFIIGVALIAQLLPTTFLGMIIGPFIEGVNRRLLLICADLMRLIVVLLMIPFKDSVTGLLVLLFIHGIGTAFFEPARMASVPDLVGKERISTAIGLFQATTATLKFIAPALAGLFLNFIYVEMLFLVDALTFLISALIFLNLKILGSVKTVKKLSYLESLKEGFKGVYEIKILKRLLIILLPTAILIGVFTTNQNSLMLNTLNIEAIHYGFLQGIIGGGTATAAILAPKLTKKLINYQTLFVIGIIGFSLTMTLVLPVSILVSHFGILVLYIWCLIAGINQAFINFPLANIFLSHTPDHLRARSITLFQTLLNTGLTIGILLGGILANIYGVVEVLLGFGLAFLILTSFVRKSIS